ncbi:hypothetical protein E4H12_07140 [Candidatus Thorarchaeota archaeon]|nr:MAG: hypothetical protein E4H12_07140 [Candidatus Thorarchaeota archaeon]
MTIGLVILGLLSFSLALFWFRRLVVANSFIEPISKRFGEPDTSGKKQYTNCDSHKWAIKNIVFGSHLQSSERFRSFMMDRTMTGTLLLGILLAMIPVIIVYLLFLSFNVIGTSLVLIFIAVYIMKGPGTVEISNLLLKWQTQQDLNTFNIGDLAYARVSQKSIKKWIQNLIIIGIVTIAAAPWGEEIPIALAYMITVFLGFVYTNMFIPISVVSMPLAFTLFIIIGPLLIILAGVALVSVKKKVFIDGSNDIIGDMERYEI